jgi:hypothetical protein
MKLISCFKYAFIASFFLYFSSSAVAQSTYLQVSTGYNFSIASLTDGSEMSYGKGITPAITAGRMFTNSIGAELGIGYLFGSKYENKYSFQESFGPYNQSKTTNAEIAKYSRMVLLQPSFVVSGDNTGTRVYAKFGPVIGLGKMHEKYKEYSQGSTMERDLEFRGGAALGGQTTLGLNFNAGAKNAFFAEANLRLLWYSPTNGEVVKLLLNGKDRTADMSVRGREVVYVKSPHNSYGNYNSPAQMPKQNHPFSSAGFNIGIKHTF